MVIKDNILPVIREVQGLLESGQHSQAEHVLDDVIAKQMSDPEIYHLKGLACSFRRDFEAASHWIKKAIRKGGPQWLFFKNLGVINYHMGNLEEAVDCFTKTIRLAPSDYESYGYLSDARKYHQPPPLLNTIEHHLKNKLLNRLQKAQLHFAAGKIYDDLGQVDRAFPHFVAANHAASRMADMEFEEQKIEGLIAAYTPAFVNQSEQYGIPGVSPVFIVGMPRSGTSLLEQVITSHPRGLGVGEIPDIEAMAKKLDQEFIDSGGFPAGLNHIQSAIYRKLGMAYLQRLTELTNDSDRTKRVVNSSPLNFKYIGLIKTIFPDSRIIHIRRNPIDTCLSCYFTYFVSDLNFTFNMPDLARFYGLYEKLMTHWNTVMPDGFISIDYEKLVSKPEQQGRLIVDFLGLSWDQSCASPQLSDNPMQSASAWQVRQPVYTTSIGRWRKYEPYIQPLMDNLPGMEHGKLQV